MNISEVSDKTIIDNGLKQETIGLADFRELKNRRYYENRIDNNRRKT